MEYFKKLFSNISKFIGAMAPSQAIMLVGVVAGIIVGGFVVTSWLGSINYAPLYSRLDAAEAGEVVNYLAEQNIPYKLSDGGATISIPSGDVYRVRISLASQGMPRSGNVGYSIFDESNLGMTEFLQNLNFRRALEGELMRTIMQLSGVKAARVHIVMPKDRLFKKDKLEATASVVLKLSSPTGLTKSQIAGITHLVASSVEGLKPENISIIDYNGTLLSSKMESDHLAGLSSSQLEVRKNVENYLEEKAQTMLDGLVGTGKSIVRVTAELDFQQLEKTSETYDPNTTAIRSQQRTDESKTASDKQEEVAVSSDENKVETSITNFEINKTVEHLVNSVGTISRLSVAVLLDGAYTEKANAEGVIESVYEPRSPEEIDNISSIVKNAIGFDGQRNDQIEVVNLAFDKTSMEFEQDKLDTIYQQEFYLDVAKKVGMVLLGILAFLYLRKKVKKLFASLGSLVPQQSYMRSSSGKADAISDETAKAIEDDELQIKPQKRATKLADQMTATAQKRPEEMAKVIKTMMAE